MRVPDVLRTPDDRFSTLPDWPWQPRYLDALSGFDGLRLHYIDEGPRDAPHTVLCLHGQPTWGYLYRRMIPQFIDRGFRVVVPDLFGFGRSDKPTNEEIYTFDFHRKTLAAVIRQLDLRSIVLVCQDWGGILGLTLPMDAPERFVRLLVMNTMLPTGDEDLGDGFRAWRAWCRNNPDMAIGRLMRRSTPHLTGEEAAAYDAPFLSIDYKAGVRRFPELLPDHPDAPGAELGRAARDWWSREWAGSSSMVIGGADPVLGEPIMMRLRRSIRDCPAPVTLPDAGHFVQEWAATSFGGRVADIGVRP